MGGRDFTMESVIREFRGELPAQCATAKAIDAQASWDTIAMQAVADGYIEAADRFKDLVEAVLRRAL